MSPASTKGRTSSDLLICRRLNWSKGRHFRKPSAKWEGDIVEQSRLPSEIERFAALAERDERVTAALRFFQRGDWVSFYKA